MIGMRRVCAALVLGDVALVAALDHLLPRLQPIGREPPHGEDKLAAGHDVLQAGAAITERAAGQVPALVGQEVERHVERRRGDGVGVRLAEPVEAGPELLVEDGRLPVEHQRAGGQLRDGGGKVSETAGVVAAVPAHQADAIAVLVCEDPPPVDLFLVDPAVAVERLADERRGHRQVMLNHHVILPPASDTRTQAALRFTRRPTFGILPAVIP
jgi:hypothetical protein